MKNMKKKKLFAGLLILTAIMATGCSNANRNIAFRRAVYQSSAANFNNTAQLATDGIFTTNKDKSASENSMLDSRWLSQSNLNEWIYIDLGEKSAVKEVKLYWGEEDYASHYEIQISDDASAWQTVFTNQAGAGGIENCKIENTAARYVRLYCIAGQGERFALTEMEVSGSNNLQYTIAPLPQAQEDGTQYLRGGNWRVQRASEVEVQDGKVISTSSFKDNDWLPAVVPGTVLWSYLQAGAIPDPSYGEQQRLISDSFFTADFWYRNSFKIPASQKGKTVWLNFDAINWKADVYLNGSYVGRINGAFIRGMFDITKLVKYGKENHLAVFIHKNDTPGAVTIQDKEWTGHNGGLLGADNPTIHASVGWDWLPTIRGRNIGIYNDVFISYTQDVQLRNSWTVIELDTQNKDFSKAGVNVRTELSNSGSTPQSVIVKGRITPGDYSFQSAEINLQPGETREISVADVVMDNPHLWWPNTYGDQFLYDAELAVVAGEKESDKTQFKFGVRQFTYHKDYPLMIYCNGVRIICRGGNWGMDDGNLATTKDEYETKIRMHAEANFTMIRNWVGMTRNDEFYHACDRYGILIWDDFWLANPGDGPNPNDENMFMQNAVDKVKRNRYHTSLALYCGRNEGDPPKSLNEALKTCTNDYDGTRHYIAHSAAGVVSGWGPYSVRDSEWYFENTYPTLHSERGMPNIPSAESLEKMLPPENRWPIDNVWGIHDFTMGGAQHGSLFLEKMEQYGKYDDLHSFSRVAQFVNYQGHKSMFEAVYTNNSNGMIMWMSQSAWPSMVWQIYDYYYDTNAGYYAMKNANQPLNIIYNASTRDFVLTNSTGTDREDLKINIRLYDINGQLTGEDSFTKDAAADSRQTILNIAKRNLPGIVFIKSEILDNNGRLLAYNFNWFNADGKKDYQAFSQMREADVVLKAALKEEKDGASFYTAHIANQGDCPALMVRIKTTDAQGNLILPTYYDDNYISLMPGESREIQIEINNKYLKGKPLFHIEGWNLK